MIKQFYGISLITLNNQSSNNLNGVINSSKTAGMIDHKELYSYGNTVDKNSVNM